MQLVVVVDTYRNMHWQHGVQRAPSLAACPQFSQSCRRSAQVVLRDVVRAELMRWRNTAEQHVFTEASRRLRMHWPPAAKPG